MEVDEYKTVGPCANLKLTKDEGEYPFTELFHFLLSFDRITPLGYNCDPSMKTPAENPLFGVLINIIWSRKNAQAYLSTQDPAARACTRFPPTHVQRRWSPGAKAAAFEGSHPPDRPQQFARQARPLVGFCSEEIYTLQRQK